MTESTLNDKANKAADQADRLIAPDGRNLSETADQLKKAVNDKAAVAKDWAGERAGVARDWALDQSDVIRDTVQTRPFVSVGVSVASAFALGLVIGVLLAQD